MRENTDREMIFKGMARLVFKVRLFASMRAVTQGPVGIPHHRLSLSLSSWHLSHTWMYCMGGIKTDCGINEGWGSTSRIQALAGSLKSWCDDVARLCADAIMCLRWLCPFVQHYGEMRVTLAALESKSWHDLAWKLRMIYSMSKHIIQLKQIRGWKISFLMMSEWNCLFYLVHSSANVMHSIIF